MVLPFESPHYGRWTASPLQKTSWRTLGTTRNWTRYPRSVLDTIDYARTTSSPCPLPHDQDAISIVRKAVSTYILANPGTVVDGLSYAAYVTGVMGTSVDDYCEAYIRNASVAADPIAMDGTILRG